MDWKTTVVGIVTGVCTILSHFNVIIPDSFQVVIIAVGVALLGLFAKDIAKKD